MPREAKGLSAVAVQKAKPGRYFDGDGLVLTVRGPDAKYWSFRFWQDGKLREMGLGSATGKRAVTLKQARRKAEDCFELHKAGTDPLAARKSKAAIHANAILSPTFQKVAIDYIEANRSSWSNGKHAEQWLRSLQQYVFPKIGQLPVADIQVSHVEAVLLPIWNDKRVTARRVRGRIEKILGAAKVKKLRDGENPAAWEENLDSLLPVESKNQRAQKQHHAAMPYSQISNLMAELRGVEMIHPEELLKLSPYDAANLKRKRDLAFVAAAALQVTILCAARAGETLSAKWDEVDLGEKVWTVPAEKMKAGKEHKIPLSPRAVAILQEMARHRGDSDFIFHVGGEPLVEWAMLRLLQRDLKRSDATVHGFRSSFGDWRAEQTSYASEIAEAALAHAVPDAVERVYKRTTFFDRRRQLMNEWAAHCSKPAVKRGGKVVSIGHAS